MFWHISEAISDFFIELNFSFTEHKFKLLSTETFDANDVFRSWADVLGMAMNDETMACAECFSCSCSLSLSCPKSLCAFISAQGVLEMISFFLKSLQQFFFNVEK